MAALLGPPAGARLLEGASWLPWPICAVLCGIAACAALAIGPAVRRRTREGLTH